MRRLRVSIADPDKKSKYHFCVDDPKLTGSPAVGYGRTFREALGNWACNYENELGISFDFTEEANRIESKRIMKELERER